jgi:putative thioredoxin
LWRWSFSKIQEIDYGENMTHEFTSFESDVVERSRDLPVVVDFWASWCGPCLMFAPILEKAAAEAGGSWMLVKVNTEEHPELSAQYRVRSLPTLLLFVGGEPVAESLGALTEAQLKTWLARSLPSAYDSDLDAAEGALAAGRADLAREKADGVLASEPGNARALFLRAAALLGEAPDEVGSAVDALPVGSEFAGRAVALRELAKLLLPEETEEGERTAAILAEGVASLRRLDYDGACRTFLEVLETDRRFREEIAAKFLKQIFLYLGPRHPVTEKHQRRFASLLFS